MNKRAAALSIGLHLAVLLPFLPSCTAAAPPPPPPPQDRQVGEPQVTFIATAEEGEGQCESSYAGIGVMAGMNGEVWNVAPDGPAARANIFAGDVITNIDILRPNSMPVGTLVDLTVRRGTQFTTKTLRIGTVCYS